MVNTIQMHIYDILHVIFISVTIIPILSLKISKFSFFNAPLIVLVLQYLSIYLENKIQKIKFKTMLVSLFSKFFSSILYHLTVLKAVLALKYYYIRKKQKREAQAFDIRNELSLCSPCALMGLSNIETDIIFLDFRFYM